MSTGIGSIDGAALDVRLDQALAAIAAGAEKIDREPRFPSEAFQALGNAGALEASIGAARADESVLGAHQRVGQLRLRGSSAGK